MIIRKKFLPKGLHDIAFTTFLSLIAIPLIYWFELWVVLPEIFGESYSFYIHAIIGTFMLTNIASNLLAVMMCDTSIRGMILIPAPATDTDKNLEFWRFCSVCETMAPPRSWHCDKCKTCILKRDHHCVFTGHCIGFKNHRYFMWLLFWLFAATAYANIFNNYYFWVLRKTDFLSLFNVMKLFFPLAMLAVEQTTEQLYLLVYFISMIGMVFVGVLLVFHIKLVINGTIVHERQSPLYNLGRRRNIEMVFGKRWYLTWISPFVYSQLPHDGIHFENLIQETTKSK